MEKIQIILSLIATGIALIGTITGLIIKLVKIIKQLSKTKNWKEILYVLFNSALTAELSGKTGNEKKYYVLNDLQKYCDEKQYDLDLDSFSTIINLVIKFANNFKEIAKK